MDRKDLICGKRMVTRCWRNELDPKLLERRRRSDDEVMERKREDKGVESGWRGEDVRGRCPEDNGAGVQKTMGRRQDGNIGEV